MDPERRNDISLHVPAETAFLPLAVALAEKSALAFGLAEKEALLLTLSTEELFSFLCQAALGQELEIRCTGGGYYVQVEFIIPVKDINLKPFNLTTKIKPDEEASLDDLGLVIASRSVDRFQIREEKGRGLHLCLIKEKSYPPMETGAPVPARPLSNYTVRPPDREELKTIARMAFSCYPAHVLPPFFRYPGKVADMADQGEFRSMTAVDSQGRLGGAIFWYWQGVKTVSFSGPYLFNQPGGSDMAVSLLETLLAEIVRTPAVGLLSRFPTAELPLNYFDPLGTFYFFPPEGTPLPVTAYFRHIKEDMGSPVWSQADLVPFLQKEFRRMVLPREIRELKDFGERKNPHSVLSARFDRGGGIVTLYPLRPGLDKEENVSNHLRLLHREGWRNLFFEMDLAKSWQVEFSQALFKNHFQPRLLLPYAGEGDLVIFQAEEF